MFLDYFKKQSWDWIYVAGYPISEPYWAHISVAGQPRSVLEQVFERRTITYDPAETGVYKVQFGNVGLYPWDAADPIVLDTSAASTLGYSPVGDYAATAAEEVDWLVTAARGGADAAKLPRDDDPFFAPLLDYTAEDRLLEARATGPAAERSPLNDHEVP